jgi:hypothetical protein
VLIADTWWVSDLQRVPPRSRLLLGGGLAIPAAALLAAGVLMVTDGSSAAMTWLGIGVVVVAVLLLAVATGLTRSAVLDLRRCRAAEAEAALDAAIMASESYRALVCDTCDHHDGDGACSAADCAVRTLPRRS